MEIKVINLDGRKIYQASWQGAKARSHNKEQAIELLQGLFKLREAWGITENSHA